MDEVAVRRPGTAEIRFAIASIPGGVIGGVLAGMLAAAATDTDHPASKAVTFVAVIVYAGFLVTAVGMAALARGLWLRSNASREGAWALFATLMPYPWWLLTVGIGRSAVHAQFEPSPSSPVFDGSNVIIAVLAFLMLLVVLSGVIEFFRWLWRKVA